MAISTIQKFFTHPASRKQSNQVVLVWFTLSLTYAALCGSLWLHQAFSSEYVAQDDARQQVFWMRQFLDPELFSNDLIADYFQSIAPKGWSALYRIMATLGIDPIFFSKILPFPLILLTTAYCFLVCIQILPVPATGFIASVLLNQYFLVGADMTSGTPRDFVYLLYLSFFYYLIRRSVLPCLGVIFLTGLFYPTSIFIQSVLLILRLVIWNRGHLTFSRNRLDYLLCGSGLGIAFLVLLPYALSSSEFGPTITLIQANAMPDALITMTGKTFLDRSHGKLWLLGEMGLIPGRPFQWPLVAPYPPLIFTGILLPILLRYSSYFPLAQRITRNVLILPQALLASYCMFFISHAILFKLHYPGRYTGRIFWIVLALAAALVVTVVLDTILPWLQRQRQTWFYPLLSISTVLLFAVAVVCPPVYAMKFTNAFRYPRYPQSGYAQGTIPQVYEFFLDQPKDSVIASLSPESQNIPTFAKRSILVSKKYAIPFHLGYYRQIRQRIFDQIRAQYSPSLPEVQDFIRKYKVDFWLIYRPELTLDYLMKNKWLNAFKPVTPEAIVKLKQGKTPALAKIMNRCSVLDTEDYMVVPTDCIMKELD